MPGESHSLSGSQVLSPRSILLPLFLFVPGPEMSTFLLAEGGEGQDEHEINPRDFISTPTLNFICIPALSYPASPPPSSPSPIGVSAPTMRKPRWHRFHSPLHRHCLLPAFVDNSFTHLRCEDIMTQLEQASLASVLADQHGILAPSRRVFQRRNAPRVRLPLRRRCQRVPCSLHCLLPCFPTAS